jgi:serine/threonine protein kinase
LLDSELQTKLTDFGLARTADEDEGLYQLRSSQIPIRWTAPEVLAAGTITSASDVFAFGVTINEMFEYGQVPFRHLRTNNLVSAAILGGERPARAEQMPDDVWNVVEKCWSQESHDRPTPTALVELLQEVDAGPTPSVTPHEVSPPSQVATPDIQSMYEEPGPSSAPAGENSS